MIETFTLHVEAVEADSLAEAVGLGLVPAVSSSSAGAQAVATSATESRAAGSRRVRSVMRAS